MRRAARGCNRRADKKCHWIDGGDSGGSVGGMPLPERATCGDCGAHEGEIHDDGCDMERCTFCGHQRISCDCPTQHFYPNMIGLDVLWTEDERARATGRPVSGIPKWARMRIPQSVYEHGLDDAQAAEWEAVEAAKGRVPFILYPNICRRCGELWPDMFRVSDEEWARYVEPEVRGEMLCRGCWDQIKGYIDGAASGKVTVDE